MIVEADFITHWKTKALANRIGMEATLTALLSLWGHCQTRRAWEFRLTPIMLAGICGFTGEPRFLLESMVEIGFLDDLSSDPSKDPSWYQVHDWGKCNVALVAKWGASKGKGHVYNPRGANAPSSDPSKPRFQGSRDPSSDHPIEGGDRIGEDRIGEDTPKAPKGADMPESLSLVLDDPAPPDPKPSAADQKKERGAQARQLYAAYPRKKAPDEAQRAFEKRLAAGVPFEVLLAAVQRYAAECVGKDPQYIAYPASWANAGQFADEPDAVVAGQKNTASAPVASTEPDGWRDAWPCLYDDPCPAAWAALADEQQVIVRRYLAEQNPHNPS